MGDTKDAARRALLEVLLLVEWNERTSSEALADKADALLDTLARWLDARAQSRAGQLKPGSRNLRCAEHDRMMPHWGCEETAERVRAGGGPVEAARKWIGAHQTHPFVRSDDPDFGRLNGGACAFEVDGVVCGWPRGAHR